MNSQELIARCRELEAPGMRTFVSEQPLVIRKAVGSRVEDVDGNAYIDLSGFHGVTNIGHAHPAVADAIARQAHELIHCITSYPSPVRVAFYEALASIVPPELQSFLPVLTGGMANELAVLIARTRKPDGEIIAFSGGYHGRSVGTVGLAGKTRYRRSLGVTTDAQFVPFPYPLTMGEGAVDEVIATLNHIVGPGGGVESVAGVIVEPIQGNGGVVIPPDGFLRALRQFCDKNDALLIVDEIQSGGGRTGRMWAYEYDGALPDIVTIGKAIAGGMPVAVVAARKGLVTFPPDSVAGTFLVNNVNLAAAIAAISVLRDGDLAERSRALGEKYLGIVRQRLSGLPAVAEVRGKGLWLAVELRSSKDKTAPATVNEIIREVREREFLIASGGYTGNVVKIAPALNIDEDDLARGIDVMMDVIVSRATK